MLRIRLALSLCLVLLSLSPRAAALSVALVGPSVRAAQTNETLSRMHGELLSLGFDVIRIDRSGPHEDVERVVAERRVDAALAVLPSAIEVWIAEGAQGRYAVTRVSSDVEADNASEQLAIRAIEVLRSELIEAGLVEHAARAPAPPSAAREPSSHAPDPRHTEPPRVGLELGAAALTSFDGVGPAVSPLLRLNLQVRSWLLRASFAGFGTRPSVVSAAGGAHVAQQQGLLGASYLLAALGPFTPSLGVALGVLHTSVEGYAASPKQGHVVDRWSMLLDGSVGTAFQLSRRYYLTLAMHVQVAEPYVAIRFVDDAVASTGRPNLLMTCSLGGWL